MAIEKNTITDITYTLEPQNGLKERERTAELISDLGKEIEKLGFQKRTSSVLEGYEQAHPKSPVWYLQTRVEGMPSTIIINGLIPSDIVARITPHRANEGNLEKIATYAADVLREQLKGILLPTAYEVFRYAQRSSVHSLLPIENPSKITPPTKREKSEKGVYFAQP